MSRSMAAGRPAVCPQCGQEYAFRLGLRQSQQARLKTHYRCGRAGGYVYVHEIEMDGPPAAFDGGETA